MPLMKAHRPNFHMVTAWISKDSTEPEATEFGEWKVSVLTQRPDKKKKRKGKCPNESYISREGHGTHPRDWDKRMGGVEGQKNPGFLVPALGMQGDPGQLQGV